MPVADLAGHAHHGEQASASCGFRQPPQRFCLCNGAAGWVPTAVFFRLTSKKHGADLRQDIIPEAFMSDTTTPMMTFDRPRKQRLRAAYNAALAADQEQFTFEGAELLTSYARYVLMYLDTKLPNAG